MQFTEAVWQFRLFERASLHYLDTKPLDTDPARPVCQWDQAITEAELHAPLTWLDDALLAALIAERLLEPGVELTGADTTVVVAVVTADLGLSVAGVRYGGPDAAATGGRVRDGWSYRRVPGLGSLAESAGLLQPAE